MLLCEQNWNFLFFRNPLSPDVGAVEFSNVYFFVPPEEMDECACAAFFFKKIHYYFPYAALASSSPGTGGGQVSTLPNVCNSSILKKIIIKRQLRTLLMTIPHFPGQCKLFFRTSRAEIVFNHNLVCIPVPNFSGEVFFWKKHISVITMENKSRQISPTYGEELHKNFKDCQS